MFPFLKHKFVNIILETSTLKECENKSKKPLAQL